MVAAQTSCSHLNSAHRQQNQHGPRREDLQLLSRCVSSLGILLHCAVFLLAILNLRLCEVPSSRSTSNSIVMILVHVLVRVGIHVCSHHLVHYSPCLQTRNVNETTRFGCVSLRLCFVLLGRALGVLWFGWSWACCCLCWHWPCRGRAGIWLFASLAAGGCGRAPSYLCRCSPCHLASQT